MTLRGRVRSALLVIAALIAAYLTLLHYTTIVPLACPGGSASGLINCGNVLTSQESTWFGIPVPAVGFLWALIGIALTWGQGRERPWASDGVYWIWSVVGVLTVLWLVYAEFALIHNICAWCSILHLIILALFVEWVWSGSLIPLADDEEA